MDNTCELSINVVKVKKPKMLIGFAKRHVAGTGSFGYPVMDRQPPAEREVPNPLGYSG